jgi:hypothetical protein
MGDTGMGNEHVSHPLAEILAGSLPMTDSPQEIEKLESRMRMRRPRMAPATQGLATMSQGRDFIHGLLIDETGDDLRIAQNSHARGTAE